MRIDMLGSEWFASRPGGLNRYFQSLYEALNANPQADVQAIAFGDPIPSDPRSHSWGPTGSSTIARYSASQKRPSSDQPAIIDRHFCVYGPPVRSYNDRTRHLIHFQGPWAEESQVAGAGSMATRAKKAVEKWRYRTGDHFVVLSDLFKAALVEDYGIEEKNISKIPPGVNVKDFEFEPDRDTGRPVVLCVRRLERRMGIHVLIEGWDRVRSAHPDAQLRIVGTGTYEKELRELAAASQHSDSIVFDGRLPDAELREAYKNATVTVVPSVALEGFGLIALESLATGRVPIVTNCGGLPDAVRDLDPSLVVPVGSSDALATRIVEALEGDRPSAVQAREHALAFSWDRIADKHLDLYSKLIM